MVLSKQIILSRADADSAWKDVLDVYFEEFMQFFYPELAAEIDWAAGYEVLDKELHAITTDALVGERLVDKLIKVKSLRGEELWLLIHLEVQGNKEATFNQRLFEYYYRLYERYRRPIKTIAVLADDDPNWRPTMYKAQVWGEDVLTFQFSSLKLLDYRDKKETLLQTRNPFGTVVLACLAALETRQNIEQRFNQKFQLTRRLYEQGLGRNAILNLYKFIDWCIALPEALEVRYNENIKKLEEEKNMSYITTAERIGKAEGRVEGKAEGKAEGIIEGELKANRALAKNALAENLPLELIHKLTKIPMDELKAMQKENVH